MNIQVTNKGAELVNVEGYGGIAPGGKLWICAADVERVTKLDGIEAVDLAPEPAGKKRAGGGQQ